MKRIATLACSMFLGLSTLAFADHDTISSGTKITVRTDESIDVRDINSSGVYRAQVAEDVRDHDGNVLIPRGSDAELRVVQASQREMAIALESVSVNGRRYLVPSEAENRSSRSGLGKNERTGKYVGGGAALGAIVGAIAGGGKGAAIGALVGGAAGAGTQVLTRGKEVHIPAESTLTFRLQEPMRVAAGRRSFNRR